MNASELYVGGQGAGSQIGTRTTRAFKMGLVCFLMLVSVCSGSLVRHSIFAAESSTNGAGSSSSAVTTSTNRQKFTGTITYVSRREAWIHSANGNLEIAFDQVPELVPGDEIEVSGELTRTNPVPMISSATVLTRKKGTPKLPEQVGADQLLDQANWGRLVEVSADLMHRMPQVSGEFLLLHEDGLTFEARIRYPASKSRRADLVPGIRCKLVGVLVFRLVPGEEKATPRILVRDSTEIKAITRPPWPLRRTLAVVTALSCALAAGLVALAFSLRRMREAKSRLEANEIALRDMNRGLDERIRKATDELATTNSRLSVEVDEHRKANLALADSERRYRALVEGTDVIVWEFDPTTNAFTYVSPQAARVGYPLEDWLRPGFWQAHIHDEDRDAAVAYCAAETAQRRNHRFQYRMLRPDGTAVWLEDSVSVEPSAGNPLVLRGIMADISDRKFSEEALRRSELEKTAIIDSALDCIVTTDALGNVLDFNPAAERTFGCASQAVRGRSADRVVVPSEGREIFNRLLLEALQQNPDSTGRMRREMTAVRADGTCFPAEVLLARPSHGGAVALILFLRDLSEQRKAESEQQRLEAQLRQSQKMESLGTLAGGIAHDFNNILGAIIGFGELVKMDVRGNPVALENINEVLRASLRARDLVKQMLDFSRQTEPSQSIQRLQKVIEGAVPILRSAIPHHILLTTSIHDDVPEVLADPAQIQQVLINLVSNSAHAIGTRPGRIDVSYSLAPASTRQLPIAAPGPSGFQALLTVTDDGPGMSEEVVARVFDPFFTTRDPGGGSGLGLSVVHGIVEEHEGHITLSSAPGSGTKVQIFLPLYTAPATHSSTALPDDSPGAGEEILVVDDELPMMKMAVTALRRLGYKPTGATSVSEALTRFAAHSDRFELVLTDFAMPHQTGIDLARRIQAMRPDIPMVLWTAHANTITSETARELGFYTILTKPVESTELARVVRAAINSRREPDPQLSTL